MEYTQQQIDNFEHTIKSNKTKRTIKLSEIADNSCIETFSSDLKEYIALKESLKHWDNIT